MRIPGVILVLLACLAAAGLPAADDAMPEIGQATKLSNGDREDEFPATGCAPDGTLWVAWVSWDGTRDRVLVRRASDTTPEPPLCVSGDAKDCWRPAMARDGDGRLWVSWAQNEAGNWDLWASYLWEGKWCPPLRLTTSPGNDFAQQIVTDARGRLWMAWQAVEEQNFEIFVARVTPQGIESRHNVSRHPANDWEPSLAADSQGGVYVGWDTYRYGSYDVLVCAVRDDRLDEPRIVTASPDYEAHASLAMDPQDRLWVAWDNGGPAWGQHGETRQRLHSRRSVHVRCLVDGRWHEPESSLMQALPSEMRSFVELPRLQVDARGRLWVVVRHLTDLTPPGTRMVGGQARPYQARGIWNPYVLCYDDNGWSSPVRIPSSNGRNDMRTSLCLDRQGALWAAWAEDGRVPTRAEEPGNHEVYAARLNLSRTPVASPAVKPMKPSSAASADLIEASLSRPRHEMTLAGVSYRLVFGDTHRHTDISRCAMNFDGSLMDTYRYAIDAAGLDFLAISDHDQDLLKHRYSRDKQGPLQDYAWWRSQKYCDLFHLEGRFLPIYGYEHGGSFAQRGGHKNVMFLQRGNPCFEEDSPEELFFVLRDREAVVIPHQLADGSSATDWGKWNVQFERVAEIFQARGSYEFFGCPREAAVKRQGHYLRDALDSGVRVGVIASSDHGLVHNAYAGTYVRDFTRAGILEALRSRRSYGATETIVLDFRCGDRPLGSEVVLDGPPQFQVNARGTEPLDSVEIVRDGKIVYSVRPEAQSSEFRYTDMDLGRGQAAYYYLRCRQTDDQWAWSSAIWVARN